MIYRDPSRPATGVAAQLQHLREFVAPHCHALTLHVRSRALSAEIIAAGGLDATLAAALMLWVEKPEVVEALDYPGLYRLAAQRAAVGSSPSWQQWPARPTWSGRVQRVAAVGGRP